ncbi:hypothetical protein [Parathalassolituus penaei]|uniref:Uncharacterized protein n=1 Tax=Parathalassolituus penaei TaxID=2997323 RepID=A0A9X3IT35_9GAMM|nr:hypothetical protein [Parathalassolituus penaei]MCY0965885.1 hypothetical protein [Parathalassolituus penaei]
MTHSNKRKADLLTLVYSPFGHLNSGQKSFNRMLLNSWQNQMQTGEVLCSRHLNLKEIGDDMVAFQKAIVDRMTEQQVALLEGIKDIQDEYCEYQETNTLTKLMDNNCNIAGQMMALAQSQMTGWAQLLDNIQVDYGYWLYLQAEKAKQCECKG